MEGEHLPDSDSDGRSETSEPPGKVAKTPTFADIKNAATVNDRKVKLLHLQVNKFTQSNVMSCFSCQKMSGPKADADDDMTKVKSKPKASKVSVSNCLFLSLVLRWLTFHLDLYTSAWEEADNAGSGKTEDPVSGQ